MSALAITKDELAWNPVEGMARYARARQAVRDSAPKPEPAPVQAKPAPIIIKPAPRKRVIIVSTPVYKPQVVYRRVLTRGEEWQAFEAAQIIAAQEQNAFQQATSCEEPTTIEGVQWLPSSLFGKIKVEQLIKYAAIESGVSREDIVSHRRTAHIVRPRQWAMYLCKSYTLRSLPEIGRKFGHRDHTTVLHACRKMANLVEAGELKVPTRDEILNVVLNG